jgi:MFS family permease
MVGFCLMVGLVGVPLFVNSVITADLDEGALLAGILLGALTIPMALASIPGGMWTTRSGYRWPTVAGLAIAVSGFALASGWGVEVTQGTMATHMVLAGIGLGLTVAPISTSVVNAVGPDERGIASALVLVMRLVGMTISTSVMTTYGLRRSDVLIADGVAALGEGADFFTLGQLALGATAQTIGEMMLIAAGVALVGSGLAWLMKPRDRDGTSVGSEFALEE